MSARGAGWEQPATIGSPSANASVTSPLVALNGRGDAIVTWGVLSPSGANGALVERRSGGGWTTPRQLPQVPQSLAMNDRGDALVAWGERVDGKQRIAVSYRRAGGTWQKRWLLSPEGEDAFDPQVALDAKGGALALWSVSGPVAGDNRIEVAARPPGGPWGWKQIVSFGINANLAVAPDGRALLAWSQVCTSVTSPSRCLGEGLGSLVVRVATRTIRGVWSRPQTLSVPEEDARLADAQVNAGGAAVAVWETYAPNPAGPLARSLKAAVGKIGRPFGKPQLLFRGFVDYPARAALAPTGDAVVVWSISDRVYASARRPHHRFGPAVPIGDGFEPDVGMDARGTSTVVWTRPTGSFPFPPEVDLLIRAARRPVGGAFGAGVDLAPVGRDCTHHRGCDSEVKLAVASNGRAVAAWRAYVAGDQPPPESFLQATEYTTRNTR